MISESGDPVIAIAITSFIFSCLAFASVVKIDAVLEPWKRSLNRVEYMLGIEKTKELTFREFTKIVRELEKNNEFSREKYQRYYEDE